jgi:hypothetical protein
VLGACDARFRPLLERLGSRALEESEDVIFGVWGDFTLAYTNPSWARFAMANDAGELFLDWALGRSVLDACGPELRPFYELSWRRVLETGEPLTHQYVCHAPHARRSYAMRVLRAAGDALIVSNALVAEVPIDEADADRLAGDDYRGPDGWIQQCPHCRRVRAVATPTPNRWDLVPRMLERRHLPSVTHALCALCFAYHYHQHFSSDELRAILDELMGGPKGR